tara:strand:- start:774 stop:1220 length:447 start_codon:yes stop_codon:yes gene_type:complete
LNTAFIALGSNLHNPIYHLEKGMRQINHLPKTSIIKRSSLYKTKPLGPKNQPNFINAVIKIKTNYKPIELLNALQNIENKHHRRRIKKWGPRTLDLDILIFNQIEMVDERLIIPHPEMINRDFVLIPLFEVTNYNFNIPKYGKLTRYI